MDKRPIGIFDSGLGGLTTVSEISKILPNENIVYLGDTARVPYGTRSKEVVEKFALEDAKFLISRNVKCIVIACNTASAYAGEKIKKQFKIPVFDVITPAIEEALKLSKNGLVGVIGTRATIASGAYDKATFMAKACPLFVPLIEEGEISGKLIALVSKQYLEMFKSSNIDTLILGCTHYPLISKIIQRQLGAKVKLVNSGKEVAVVVKEFLTKNNLLNPIRNKPKKEFYVTDLTQRFTQTAELFLGRKFDARIKKITLKQNVSKN